MRPAGAQAQCAEAGARLSRRPGPTARRGPRAGQTPASASSWGRSVGLPGPSWQIRPPAPAKQKRVNTLRRQSLFFLVAVAISRSFQSSHGGGHCARRGGACATPSLPQPLPSGVGAGGGETATRGSARSAADPIAPRPLGTPRPPPPAREASPGASRAAGRGRGGRTEGAAGRGRGAHAARPVPARHVPAPRPIAGRRRPGSEQAVVRDGGDRRCFRARPRQRSRRLRRRWRRARQRRRSRGLRPGGRPSRAGRAWGLCGRGGRGDRRGGRRGAVSSPGPGAREEPLSRARSRLLPRARSRMRRLTEEAAS